MHEHTEAPQHVRLADAMAVADGANQVADRANQMAASTVAAALSTVIETGSEAREALINVINGLYDQADEKERELRDAHELNADYRESIERWGASNKALYEANSTLAADLSVARQDSDVLRTTLVARDESQATMLAELEIMKAALAARDATIAELRQANADAGRSSAFIVTPEPRRDIDVVVDFVVDFDAGAVRTWEPNAEELAIIDRANADAADAAVAVADLPADGATEPRPGSVAL